MLIRHYIRLWPPDVIGTKYEHCFYFVSLLEDMTIWLRRPSLFMLTLSVSFVSCMLNNSIFWSQTSNKLTYLLSYLLKSNTDCKLRTCDFHWNRRSTSTFIFLHFTGNVLCWGPASRSFCHAAPHQNVQLLRSRTRSHADAVRATQHAIGLYTGLWSLNQRKV